MNKRMLGWIAGSIVTISALGLAVGTNLAKNNDVPPANPQEMMQTGSMGAMGTNLMDSPEMQQQCQDPINNTDMQQTMADMMKEPHMQAMMQQMMSGDPEFRQMMTKLVKAEDWSGQADTPALVPDAIDHNSHHAS